MPKRRWKEADRDAPFKQILKMQNKLRTNDIQAEHLLGKLSKAARSQKEMSSIDRRALLKVPSDLLERFIVAGEKEMQEKLDLLETQRKEYDAIYELLRLQILSLFDLRGLLLDICSIVFPKLLPGKVKMLREVCRGLTTLVCVLCTETRECAIALIKEQSSGGRLLFSPKRKITIDSTVSLFSSARLLW